MHTHYLSQITTLITQRSIKQDLSYQVYIYENLDLNLLISFLIFLEFLSRVGVKFFTYLFWDDFSLHKYDVMLIRHDQLQAFIIASTGTNEEMLKWFVAFQFLSFAMVVVLSIKSSKVKKLLVSMALSVIFVFFHGNNTFVRSSPTMH